MEQKQLDEIDESYFGEEFIEEDDDIKIELAKPKKEAKKEKLNEVVTKKKVTASKEPAKESKVQEEEKISEVKPVEVKELKPVVEPVAPIDPWAADEDDNSLFKEASVWKAITGIAVILLILSLFTNGFSFSETSTIDENLLTMQEAETILLSFVEAHVLDKANLPTIKRSEDVSGVYKIILTFENQDVESYVTKDGKVVFPQGFDPKEVSPTGEPVELTPEVTAPVVKEPVVPVVEEPVVPELTEPVVPELTEPVVKEPVVEAPVKSPATELSATYKKWSISPETLTVKEGDLVRLSLQPDNSNPSFSLPGLTLAIAGLDVSKEVSGSETIEFTASKKGSYELKCGSCEGVSATVKLGTLVIE